MTKQEEFLALKSEVSSSVQRRYRSADAVTVEDCFMRAVEVLLKQIKNKDIPADPKAWLRATTELTLRNELRKKRATSLEALSIDVGGDVTFDADFEVRADIELLFNILSPAYCEVIRLHDIEGLSVEEIAKVKGVSIKSIYHKHERAKAKAKQILKRLGYPPPAIIAPKEVRDSLKKILNEWGIWNTLRHSIISERLV